MSKITVIKSSINKEINSDSLKIELTLELYRREVYVEIETSLKCYDSTEYSEQTVKDSFQGREFMNDRPMIKIYSMDCFDNNIGFTDEDTIEVFKFALAKYREILAAFVM